MSLPHTLCQPGRRLRAQASKAQAYQSMSSPHTRCQHHALLVYCGDEGCGRVHANTLSVFSEETSAQSILLKLGSKRIHSVRSCATASTALLRETVKGQKACSLVRFVARVEAIRQGLMSRVLPQTLDNTLDTLVTHL
jgi:hypothetical protein